MDEHAQANAFAASAEASEKAAKQMRQDALRCEGMRSAFEAACETSVSSVLVRLATDVKEGKTNEEEEAAVKRYLKLALLALDNAKKGAETTRIHTLGKASAFETAADVARSQEKSARATAVEISSRVAAGEDEDDIRRPKAVGGIAEAQSRINASKKKTKRKPAKKRTRKARA